MRNFELHEVKTVEEAVQALAEYAPSVQLLAGGTDLMAGIMRDSIEGKGMPYPDHLIDITRIDSLAKIEVSDDWVSIGAAVTLADMIESEELLAHCPLVVETARTIASPEIREVGTLGGNLHQRPRCWFFRGRSFDCIKKGGEICYAVRGDSRHHCVVGGQFCYIIHPSDLATALLALDARGRIASPRGERWVSFDEYFVSPFDNLLAETILQPNEMLVEVAVPRRVSQLRMAWKKVNEKGMPTWDFSVVSVAACFSTSNGEWEDGRIVLGGIAPFPYRAVEIETSLKGKVVHDHLAGAVRDFHKQCRPMRDNGYKLELLGAVLEEVLLEKV